MLSMQAGIPEAAMPRLKISRYAWLIPVMSVAPAASA